MKLTMFLGGIAVGLNIAGQIVSAHPRRISTCGCETNWQWERDVSTFSGGKLEFRDHAGHEMTIDIKSKKDAEMIAKAIKDWSTLL